MLLEEFWVFLLWLHEQREGQLREDGSEKQLWDKGGKFNNCTGQASNENDRSWASLGANVFTVSEWLTAEWKPLKIWHQIRLTSPNMTDCIFPHTFAKNGYLRYYFSFIQQIFIECLLLWGMVFLETKDTAVNKAKFLSSLNWYTNWRADRQNKVKCVAARWMLWRKIKAGRQIGDGRYVGF